MPAFSREVWNLPEIHDALRDRAEQLQLTRLGLDESCKTQEGYCSKLLSPRPAKWLGPKTFGPVVRGFGLKMILVEDEAALERTLRIATPRVNPRPADIVSSSPEIEAEVRRRMRAILSARGKRAVVARLRNQTPEQRFAAGRAGARARWSKWRERRGGG